VSIHEYLQRTFTEVLKRFFDINNTLFPLLIWLMYTPKDLRIARNIKRLRQLISRIIQDRRSGRTKGCSDEPDLIEILLESEFYRNGTDSCLVDEVITLFVAGMKTVQLSTTNFIYYMTKYPQHKQRIRDEIGCHLEKAEKDPVNLLDYDTVLDFDFLG
jgi:cytochrome P450